MNLKIARIKFKWSQSDLAKRANVSRSLISQIENDRSVDSVQLGILKKLATALNSTVQELFLNEE